jgi:hypothetical protein
VNPGRQMIRSAMVIVLPNSLIVWRISVDIYFAILQPGRSCITLISSNVLLTGLPNGLQCVWGPHEVLQNGSLFSREIDYGHISH